MGDSIRFFLGTFLSPLDILKCTNYLFTKNLMTFLFEKTKCKLGKIDVFNVFFFIIIVHCVHRAFVDAGLFLVANKKR